jgi:starch synthase (maltosyl-transferring)
MTVQPTPKPPDGRRRVVIDRVLPEIDGGRFAAKAVAGDDVRVQADVFADGHDEVAVVLLWRAADAAEWHESPMGDPDNDRWTGSFRVTECGPHEYTVRAWVDHFATWRRDLGKKLDAEQDVSQELLVGAKLVRAAARRADREDAAALRSWAGRLAALARQAEPDVPARPDPPGMPFPHLAALMARYPDRRHATTYDRALPIVVDRERARFSAWYELFPRSTADETGRHGTFKDVERGLPYAAGMGFDVLYLPPIHPIGRSFRKGRNNTMTTQPGDPGSPWAIGAAEGGHTAIHPELGTVTDFERLVQRATDFGMEIAMDLAYQCSADHPWLTEHPEWFKRRPDGSIQYAENPPKKYQDIYPLDFGTPDWKALWDALRDVVDTWIGRGVRAFRVDNPHTKPFAFWEWLIGETKRVHHDVIFLSEAFTRPKVMHRLAKLGFTQSYTYFTWRNTKAELAEYFGRDLPAVRDFFRPILWPNTPDILHETLQLGGRPAFVTRLVLAATLGASYGIYGPAFELMERVPLAPGKEEYLNSEKYEIRHWDLDRPDSLAELIARVNRIRRENPALRRDDTLRLVDVDDEQLFAYAKTSPDGSNIILVVVNLDPRHVRSGMVDVPIHEWSIAPNRPYRVSDLLTGATYTWQGWRNFVMLDPAVVPAHVLRVDGDPVPASGRG